jgi:hypothetical protein
VADSDLEMMITVMAESEQALQMRTTDESHPKPRRSGVLTSDTRAHKFERSHRMPTTGLKTMGRTVTIAWFTGRSAYRWQVSVDQLIPSINALYDDQHNYCNICGILSAYASNFCGAAHLRVIAPLSLRE